MRLFLVIRSETGSWSETLPRDQMERPSFTTSARVTVLCKSLDLPWPELSTAYGPRPPWRHRLDRAALSRGIDAKRIQGDVNDSWQPCWNKTSPSDRLSYCSTRSAAGSYNYCDYNQWRISRSLLGNYPNIANIISIFTDTRWPCNISLNFAKET